MGPSRDHWSCASMERMLSLALASRPVTVCHCNLCRVVTSLFATEVFGNSSRKSGSMGRCFWGYSKTLP
jgi:hypothetical protein